MVTGSMPPVEGSLTERAVRFCPVENGHVTLSGLRGHQRYQRGARRAGRPERHAGRRRRPPGHHRQLRPAPPTCLFMCPAAPRSPVCRHERPGSQRVRLESSARRKVRVIRVTRGARPALLSCQSNSTGEPRPSATGACPLCSSAVIRRQLLLLTPCGTAGQPAAAVTAGGARRASPECVRQPAGGPFQLQ